MGSTSGPEKDIRCVARNHDSAFVDIPGQRAFGSVATNSGTDVSELEMHVPKPDDGKSRRDQPRSRLPRLKSEEEISALTCQG